MESQRPASPKPKRDKTKKSKGKKIKSTSSSTTRNVREKEATKAVELVEDAAARSSLPRDWDKRRSRSRRNKKSSASGTDSPEVDNSSKRNSLVRRVLTKEQSSSTMASGESGVVSIDDVFTTEQGADVLHEVNPSAQLNSIDVDVYGLPSEEIPPDVEAERVRRRSSLRAVGSKIGGSVGKLLKGKMFRQSRTGSIVESVGKRESDASSFTSEFAIHDPEEEKPKSKSRGRSSHRESKGSAASASKSPSASGRLRTSLLRRGKSKTRDKGNKDEKAGRKSSALRWASSKKKDREEKARRKKMEKLYPYPGAVNLRYMAPKENFVPFFGRDDTDLDYGDGARLINVKT